MRELEAQAQSIGNQVILSHAILANADAEAFIAESWKDLVLRIRAYVYDREIFTEDRYDNGPKKWWHRFFPKRTKVYHIHRCPHIKKDSHHLKWLAGDECER